MPDRAGDPGRAEALRREVEDALVRGLGPLGRTVGGPRLLGLAGLSPLLAAYRARAADEAAPAFAEDMLARLAIAWEAEDALGPLIAEPGPTLIVANHPTGGAEGLVLMALAGRHRNDWSVLANARLRAIPELADRVIGVAGPGDGAALRQAFRHLKAGGALIAFPAGTVAHPRPGRLTPREAPWHPSILRLGEKAGARLLRLRIEAEPTLRWRLLSGISRTARTALLPRELAAQGGRTIRVTPEVTHQLDFR